MNTYDSFCFFCVCVINFHIRCCNFAAGYLVFIYTQLRLYSHEDSILLGRLSWLFVSYSINQHLMWSVKFSMLDIIIWHVANILTYIFARAFYFKAFFFSYVEYFAFWLKLMDQNITISFSRYGFLLHNNDK